MQFVRLRVFFDVFLAARNISIGAHRVPSITARFFAIAGSL
jgi:hypothetical protein